MAIEKNTLYVCQEVYQRGLLNKDSAEIIKPIVRNEVVRCDSAEPKSIAEYAVLGIKAQAVKKGAGSIESGIKKIQGYDRVIIHKGCPNVLAEFKNYQWRKDKNGVVMAEPLSGFDHAIDAIRYALEDEMIYTRPHVASVPYQRIHNRGAGGWMS